MYNAFNFVGTYSCKWKGEEEGPVTITNTSQPNVYNVSRVDGSSPRYIQSLEVDDNLIWRTNVGNITTIGRAVIEDGIVDTLGTESGGYVLIKRLPTEPRQRCLIM
jgi:hypothetical protein